MAQIVVQHRAKFSFPQQLNILPVQIVADKTLRRLANRLKCAQYRGISPAHRIHRRDFPLWPNRALYPFSRLGIEAMTAAGINEG